MYEKRILT